MRTVLCFGDSNTWGYVPGSNGQRFPREAALAGAAPARARRRVGGDRRGAERPHRDHGQPRRRGPERAPVPRAVPALARADRSCSSSSSARTTSASGSRCRSATSRGRSAGSSRSRARPRPGRTDGAPEILVRLPAAVRRASPRPALRRGVRELGCALLDLDGVASYVELGDDVEHLDEAATPPSRRPSRQHVRQHARRDRASLSARSGRFASPTRTSTGRLRLDAVARYLQDVAADDVARRRLGARRAHLGGAAHGARRGRARSSTTPRSSSTTWCGGTAASAAAAVHVAAGDRGGRIDAEMTWIHLGPDLQPLRLGERFLAVYGESAAGRRASTRLELPAPPPDATRVRRGGCARRTSTAPPREQRRVLGAGRGALRRRGCASRTTRCSSTASRSTSATPLELRIADDGLWFTVGGAVRAAAILRAGCAPTPFAST